MKPEIRTAAEVSVRTGRTNTNKLSRYNNLLGAEGLKQIIDLFHEGSEAVSKTSENQINLEELPSKTSRVPCNEDGGDECSEGPLEGSNEQIPLRPATSKKDVDHDVRLVSEDKTFGMTLSGTGIDSIVQNVSSSGSGSIDITVNINREQANK